MGDCCAAPADPERKRKAGRKKKQTRPNESLLDRLRPWAGPRPCRPQEPYRPPNRQPVRAGADARPPRVGEHVACNSISKKKLCKAVAHRGRAQGESLKLDISEIALLISHFAKVEDPRQLHYNIGASIIWDIRISTILVYGFDIG
ncbi:hypothetical protein OPV22_000760 [Ensete ventricosum]|uniref:Uncharacterized protein n=1 Tax=Ensete ventricosum TaxID=4639 RepID=A0AAV8RQY8_ENSVE|nr:hypothetical protein OPV22_000760 [Ensete ventricosum]